MPFTTAPRRTATFAAAALGVACVTGGGFARPADDKKTEEKKPAFDAKDVRVGPPPELAALRAAVEEAARKGENVDEVRKQLDALEKALAGKAWVKPKPVEEPPPAPVPQPRPELPRRVPPVEFPGGLGVLQPDLEGIARAQELLLKAAELAADDPLANREKIDALRRAAQDLMTRALGGRGLFLPDGRLPAANGRLGLRVEKVPAALAEQLDLPAGRGVLIAEVIRGMTGEKVGFQANDVVLEFAGRPVTDDPTAFVRTVMAAKAGEKADVVVLRKGKKETIKAVELPPVSAAPAEGRRAIAAVPGLEVGPRRPRDDGAATKSVGVRVRDGAFTITAEEDGVKVVVEGKAGGPTPVPSRIEVTEGRKTIEAESVEKLPAEYRERVRKILDGVKVGR